MKCNVLSPKWAAVAVILLFALLGRFSAALQTDQEPSSSPAAEENHSRSGTGDTSENGPPALDPSLQNHQPERGKSKQARKYDVNRIGQREIGGGMNFYSVKREQEMGREMAEEIEQQSRVLDDPVVAEYVNRLGQDLVRHSDAKIPFVIKVLDNDEFNAFALPGGYLFLNTGTILAAENEAELAGVMAHEIAHVAARHATKNATKAHMINLSSLALGMFGGAAIAIARQVAGVAVPMTFFKFSRNAEREADLLGLEYVYATGYDPVALMEFLERLQVRYKKAGLIANSFQSHPMKEERVRRAQEVIETLLPPRDRYLVSTSAFNEVQARLAELTQRTHSAVTKTQTGPVLRRQPASPPADGDNTSR